jgi:DNA-binding PadR family transcriptional regulator
MVVYNVLDRLEDSGQVIGEWETGTLPGQPRRRFYALTSEGRKSALALLGLEGR